MNNLTLLKRGREGDKKSFDEFYLLNQGLVISLLKRFDIKKYEYEDVLQEANVGLVIAMNKFDFSYGVNFSTYAVPLILGEIRKHYRESGSVKASRSIKELSSKINKLINELSYSPSVEELSVLLNQKQENIIEAMSFTSYVDSIDESTYDDSKSVLSDTISGDDLSLIDSTSLSIALESLQKKERLIVELHYYGGLSQIEIAKRLNMTQVQVSRMESKILEKLKSIV